MNKMDSEHYVFYYNENSKAEQDIYKCNDVKCGMTEEYGVQLDELYEIQR